MRETQTLKLGIFNEDSDVLDIDVINENFEKIENAIGLEIDFTIVDDDVSLKSKLVLDVSDIELQSNTKIVLDFLNKIRPKYNDIVLVINAREYPLVSQWGNGDSWDLILNMVLTIKFDVVNERFIHIESYDRYSLSSYQVFSGTVSDENGINVINFWSPDNAIALFKEYRVFIETPITRNSLHVRMNNIEPTIQATSTLPFFNTKLPYETELNIGQYFKKGVLKIFFDGVSWQFSQQNIFQSEYDEKVERWQTDHSIDTRVTSAENRLNVLEFESTHFVTELSKTLNGGIVTYTTKESLNLTVSQVNTSSFKIIFYPTTTNNGTTTKITLNCTDGVATMTLLDDGSSLVQDVLTTNQPYLFVTSTSGYMELTDGEAHVLIEQERVARQQEDISLQNQIDEINGSNLEKYAHFILSGTTAKFQVDNIDTSPVVSKQYKILICSDQDISTIPTNLTMFYIKWNNIDYPISRIINDENWTYQAFQRCLRRGFYTVEFDGYNFYILEENELGNAYLKSLVLENRLVTAEQKLVEHQNDINLLENFNTYWKTENINRYITGNGTNVNYKQVVSIKFETNEDMLSKLKKIRLGLADDVAPALGQLNDWWEWGYQVVEMIPTNNYLIDLRHFRLRGDDNGVMWFEYDWNTQTLTLAGGFYAGIACLAIGFEFHNSVTQPVITYHF